VNCCSRVPSNARNALQSAAGSGEAEALELCGNETETSDIWGFCGAGEKGLQANADTEERLAGCNVCLDCWEVTGCRETGKAVTEVADAWQDEFLCQRARLGSNSGIEGPGKDMQY
jgi:hypothetical protein